MLVMKRNQEPTMSEFVNRFFNNDYVNRMEESFNIAHPKANIKEAEKSFEIEMIVPGFEKKDFAIEVENETLKISAKVENKTEDQNANDKFIHTEFTKMSVERNFKLSSNIDNKNITAAYNNGILTINVPKKKDALIKKMIEIK